MAQDQAGWNWKDSSGNWAWSGGPKTFKSSKYWDKGSTRPSAPYAERREIRIERDGELLAIYQHPTSPRRRWKIKMQNLQYSEVFDSDDDTDETLWHLHAASVFYFWPDYEEAGATHTWYTVQWIGDYKPIPTRGGLFSIEFEIVEIADNTGTDPGF